MQTDLISHDQALHMGDMVWLIQEMKMVTFIALNWDGTVTVQALDNSELTYKTPLHNIEIQ